MSRGRRRLLRLLPAFLWLTSAACYVPLPWPAAIPIAIGTAVVTAAVVTAMAPPPPRVVYLPPPAHPGYAWQPGYWTRQDDQWVWVDGGWVALPPGSVWSPPHWRHAPDGSWRVVPGRVVPAG